jgi:NitT/TauT family transport system substrate-binding protein
MAADNAFLQTLDPVAAATDLVDDRFVKQAINKLGGPAVFGQPLDWQRTEVIAA